MTASPAVAHDNTDGTSLIDSVIRLSPSAVAGDKTDTVTPGSVVRAYG